MKTIDMRCRPPLRFNVNTVAFTEKKFQGAPLFGGCPVAESARQKSFDLFMAEMKAANIVKGVCAVRRGKTTEANDEIRELIEKLPDTFYGMVGVDVYDMDTCLEEVEKYAVNGPFTGVNVEPAISPAGQQAMYFDDKRLSPVFELCQERNLPVSVTFGGPGYPDVTAYMPQRVEAVLKRFPRMKLCLYHGAWPWFTQMSAVCAMYPNLFVCIDRYLVNMPGWQAYVDAANYLLQDQLMFGSAYPLQDQKFIRDFYLKAGFRQEVLPKVLYDNAARFLGLEDGYPGVSLYDTFK